MSDATLYIQEAVTEHILQTIESIFTQLDGIERALVDINSSKLKIKYNEDLISSEQIMSIVQQHGLRLQQ